MFLHMFLGAEKTCFTGNIASKNEQQMTVSFSQFNFKKLPNKATPKKSAIY